MKKMDKEAEILLWSIAFPGFGQLINRKYVKGLLFFLLEFIINIMGNVNVAIMNSFLGEIEAAIAQTDYTWFLFYPCIYVFAMWDAYRDATRTKHKEKHLGFLPFVLATYLGTLGVIYSKVFTIKEQLIGPVFLPIAFMGLGFIMGGLVRRLTK